MATLSFVSSQGAWPRPAPYRHVFSRRRSLAGEILTGLVSVVSRSTEAGTGTQANAGSIVTPLAIQARAGSLFSGQLPIAILGLCTLEALHIHGKEV